VAGIVPDNPVRVRLMRCRLPRSPTLGGRVPLIAVRERPRLKSPSMLPTPAGSVPLTIVRSRLRLRSVPRSAIEPGTVPLIGACPSSSDSMRVRPESAAGRVPIRKFPVRVTCVTCCCSLHDTPDQLQQV
jgi:hypothetical protein